MPTTPMQQNSTTLNNIQSNTIADYNKEFITATSICPVAAAWVKISLSRSDGTKSWQFDVYPNNTSKLVEYQVQQSQQGGSAPPDPLLTLARKVVLDKFNFFRQLTVSKTINEGGALITLQLFDPTGFIIEEQMIYTYLEGMQDINKAVTLTLEYGWDGVTPNSKEGGWGPSKTVGGDRSYILTGITVAPEFTGVSYTLTFTDVGSTILNTRPNWWTKATLAKGSSTEKWTPPQAVLTFWRLMSLSNCNHMGVSKIMLVTDAGTYTMPLAEWQGGGIDWQKQAQPLHDYTVGDMSFLEWLKSILDQSFETTNGTESYKYRLITSPDSVPGDMSSYMVYQAKGSVTEDPSKAVLNSGWTPLGQSELSKASPVDSSNPSIGWRVPSGYTVLLINKDFMRKIANSTNPSQSTDGNSTPSGIAKQDTDSMFNLPILKTYRYLDNSREVHNTIINIDTTSNDFFANFMLRLQSPQIMDKAKPTAEKQSDIEKNISDAPTFGSLAAANAGGKCDAFPLSGNYSGNAGVVTSASDTTTSSAVGLKLQEASYFGVGLITLKLEVIGDPDLSDCLQKNIQLDFNDQVTAFVPWLKGTYFMTSLGDNVAEGMWTSTIECFKVGGLKKSNTAASSAEQPNNQNQSSAATSSPYPNPMSDVSIIPASISTFSGITSQDISSISRQIYTAVNTYTTILDQDVLSTALNYLNIINQSINVVANAESVIRSIYDAFEEPTIRQIIDIPTRTAAAILAATTVGTLAISSVLTNSDGSINTEVTQDSLSSMLKPIVTNKSHWAYSQFASENFDAMYKKAFGDNS